MWILLKNGQALRFHLFLIHNHKTHLYIQLPFLYLDVHVKVTPYLQSAEYLLIPAVSFSALPYPATVTGIAIPSSETWYGSLHTRPPHHSLMHRELSQH